MQATALIVIFALVVIASLFAAPRRATVDGFFWWYVCEWQRT